MSEHKQFFLFHWFTKDGWIGKLFAQQPGGDVSVQVGATKAAQALGTVLQYEAEVEIITSTISDNVEASTEEIVAIIKDVQAKLETISTLPDVADGLKDYRFSGDDDENKFIHDLVSLITLAFNDGKISLGEAGLIIARVIAYIKLRKG